MGFTERGFLRAFLIEPVFTLSPISLLTGYLFGFILLVEPTFFGAVMVPFGNLGVHSLPSLERGFFPCGFVHGQS